MTLPNGPQKLPILQTLDVVFQPLSILEHNFKTYGDRYTGRFSGVGEVVVVSDPEFIEAIMTAPGETFQSGPGNFFFQPFLGSRSLLMLDGKPHQRERKLLMPPFHGERLRTYGHSICNITRQVVADWQPGELFSARTISQEISLRVIIQTVFGIDQGKKAVQLQHHLNQFLSFFDRPLNSAFAFLPALQRNLGPWSPWTKLVKEREKIDQLLYSEIQERRANPSLLGDDILSLMLAARDEDGQPMTDQELRDEMITLLFAGHETTATAIAWSLYWIHRLPNVEQNLRQELAELDPNCDPATIARLPYFSALCDETLRIYPVGLFTFSRILTKNWTLMGQEFPAGTQLIPCIYLLHHRSDLYPDSKQFRPERFLEHQFSLYEYLPFGGGNRRCIGMAFALFEMKLVLATILSQWHLKLLNDKPIKPIRRGFTMAPEKGVPMQVVGPIQNVVPETKMFYA